MITRSSELLALADQYDRNAADCDCGATAMDYRIEAQRARAQAAYWARRGR